jgi:hypothetical protein
MELTNSKKIKVNSDNYFCTKHDMKTIVLPDELPIEKLQFVQVYDYHTKQEITKQQIILNQIL